jgi:hypothetical protein
MGTLQHLEIISFLQNITFHKFKELAIIDSILNINVVANVCGNKGKIKLNFFDNL